MQARAWRTPGNRRANIEEVSIPVCTCSQHRIAKCYRVTLTPGDVRAESGSVSGLVWSTGPSGLATQGDVGGHHPQCHGVRSRREARAATVQKVQCPNIQGRRNTNLRSRTDQLFCKKGPAVTVIQTTVNVCRGDIDERFGAKGASSTDHDTHGQRGAFPCRAGQYVFVGFAQSHGSNCMRHEFNN